MRKRWAITLIVPLLLGIVYYATYEIAKKSYHDRIQEKINGVAADRFYYAITTAYPFLYESSNAVISRANAIKRIASEIGFDRYYFSILWKNYCNSAESRKNNNALYNLDFFIGSNTYSSITHAPKQYNETSSSVIRLTLVGKKLQDIHNIMEMDSIIHLADYSKQIAFKCQDAIRDYANNSHEINAAPSKQRPSSWKDSINYYNGYDSAIEDKFRAEHDYLGLADYLSNFRMDNPQKQRAFENEIDQIRRYGREYNAMQRINDWRHFDTKEYDERIRKYIKLKEEPFSLFDYFFNNPLDKE